MTAATTAPETKVSALTNRLGGGAGGPELVRHDRLGMDALPAARSASLAAARSLFEPDPPNNTFHGAILRQATSAAPKEGPGTPHLPSLDKIARPEIRRSIAGGRSGTPVLQLASPYRSARTVRRTASACCSLLTASSDGAGNWL